jgi:asparagine synthase (glutamine-hydrolysing)
MCGILAILGGSLPVDPDVANVALDLQAHRGPDDRGVWQSERAWLGARRLAILDTSSRGHQPMIDDSGVVVVFNGEVYNYVELREELRACGDTFRSGCDTEVVLKSYLHWGRDCLTRFNGMWGLCIFDPRDGTAFFARDRLGVKPLYVTQARGRTSIASEAKSLLHLYPELRRVDELTLYRLLARAQIHDDERSFYDGVRVVPPAHAAVLDGDTNELTMWRYWSVDGAQPLVEDDDALERFATILEDAVRLRMRSDVPVGITLSGGLDSTAVAHGASATVTGGGSVTAFTSAWSAAARSATHDETSWARLVAEECGNIVLEEVPAARGDWLPILEQVAWHLDAPNFSPAVVPLWSIMERARSLGVKVMLEGQGADELLGGYTHHAATALLNAMRRSNGGPGHLLRTAQGYARTFELRSFVPWVAREALPFTRHAYRARRGTTFALRRDFVSRFSGLEDSPVPASRLSERLVDDLTRDILPALLHYGDAVSMAHSIEARQPFLDYRLIELCVGLPDNWKVSNGETKLILRRYLRSVGHERVAARTDKRGFPTPIWQWLVADDAAVPRKLLTSPDARILAYCSRERVERLIRHTQARPRTGANHLYRLLATELWLRACIG